MEIPEIHNRLFVTESSSINAENSYEKLLVLEIPGSFSLGWTLQMTVTFKFSLISPYHLGKSIKSNNLILTLENVSEIIMRCKISFFFMKNTNYNIKGGSCTRLIGSEAFCACVESFWLKRKVPGTSTASTPRNKGLEPKDSPLIQGL